LQIIEWLVAFLCVDEKYEIGNVDGSFFLHIDLQELALYVARRGVHLEVQCNNRELSHPAPLFSLSPTSFGSGGVISFAAQPWIVA
jgi:hypothetical protein